jgi:uncharacterized protein (DUF1697 family)
VKKIVKKNIKAMQTYIIMLRGINLGAKRKMPMQELKTLLTKLGFSDVETYIQSGNALVKHNTETSEQALEKKIETAIATQFGFDVPVMIRNKSDFEILFNNNPFIGKEGIDIEKLHVTFLEKIPELAQLEKINTYNYEPDVFQIINKEAYLHCPVDYGHTKLSNTFFESKLKMKTTTRNWKTVTKLFSMC